MDYSWENKSKFLHKLKVSRVHTVNRIFYFAFYGDNFIIAKAQRCKSSWEHFKHLLFIITKQQLHLFNRAVETRGGVNLPSPDFAKYSCNKSYYFLGRKKTCTSLLGPTRLSIFEIFALKPDYHLHKWFKILPTRPY